MDPQDEADFADADATLVNLEKTSTGAAFLASARARAKTFAETVYTEAGPVLKELGKDALPILGQIVAGIVTTELQSLEKR